MVDLGMCASCSLGSGLDSVNNNNSDMIFKYIIAANPWYVMLLYHSVKLNKNNIFLL